MWYKIFYLLSVADNLITVSYVFAIPFSLTFIIWSLGILLGDNPKNFDLTTKYRKFWYYTILILSMVFWLLIILIPSKRDCLMIIAGGSVGNFMTSDSSAAAIPSDITKFLHLSLQNEIQSLSTETKAELGLLSPKEKFMARAKDLTKEELIKFLETDSTLIK